MIYYKLKQKLWGDDSKKRISLNIILVKLKKYQLVCHLFENSLPLVIKFFFILSLTLIWLEFLFVVFNLLPLKINYCYFL